MTKNDLKKYYIVCPSEAIDSQEYITFIIKEKSDLTPNFCAQFVLAQFRESH